MRTEWELVCKQYQQKKELLWWWDEWKADDDDEKMLIYHKDQCRLDAEKRRKV